MKLETRVSIIEFSLLAAGLVLATICVAVVLL